MLIFWDSTRAAVKNVSEIFLAQALKRIRDLIFGICGDRVAVVFLIARSVSEFSVSG